MIEHFLRQNFKTMSFTCTFMSRVTGHWNKFEIQTYSQKGGIRLFENKINLCQRMSLSFESPHQEIH